MEKLTRSFYQTMNLDLETAKPVRDHLEKLGLDKVFCILYSERRGG